MKKLLIILFCLPLIGLGQITVTEVQKKQNNIEFAKNLSYSIKSGLGIEIFPESVYDLNYTFFSYYLIPNVNYNISINNKLGIYNTISLPIILRNRKKRDLEGLTLVNPDDPLMQGEERYYLTTLIAKIEYNVGVEAEITEDLEGRLGIIIPIYGVQTRGPDELGNYSSPIQWGGGFNVELDYSLSDNLCASLSVSRELQINPIRWAGITGMNLYSTWVTEILIGVNYKL